MGPQAMDAGQLRQSVGEAQGEQFGAGVGVDAQIVLPIFPLLGVSFVDGYRAVSFLSWFLNLILAEIYLRGRFERSRAARVAGPSG